MVTEGKTDNPFLYELLCHTILDIQQTTTINYCEVDIDNPCAPGVPGSVSLMIRTNYETDYWPDSLYYVFEARNGHILVDPSDIYGCGFLPDWEPWRDIDMHSPESMDELRDTIIEIITTV